MTSLVNRKAEARESFVLAIICVAVSVAFLIIAWNVRDVLAKDTEWEPWLLVVIYACAFAPFAWIDCRKIQLYFSDMNGLFSRANVLYAVLFGGALLFEALFSIIDGGSVLLAAALIFVAVLAAIIITEKIKLVTKLS